MSKIQRNRGRTFLLLLFALFLTLSGLMTKPLLADSKQSEPISLEEIEDKEGLQSFLSWFVNWNSGRPSGNKEVYDSGYVLDPQFNILANIVGCPGCFNFQDYPWLKGPEYRTGADPKGWGYSGEYYVFDGPSVDWAAKNIFHVSQKDLESLLAEAQAQRLIYREENGNSYYYISPNASGIGGVLPEARFLLAKKEGNRIALIFNMAYPALTGLKELGPYYAEVEYKKEEGSGYWTLYRYMKGVTFWPGYQGFRDVELNSWSFPGIQYVIDNKIMSGFNPVRFAPEAMTNRAMAAVILYRLENEPVVSIASPFKDVKEGDYFYRAAAWAFENSIMTGYQSGLFGPGDPISREQMAAVLYRYAIYKGMDIMAQNSLSGFPDTDKISFFAFPAMQWAVANGLIKGMNGTELAPQAGASRAQTATILQRLALLYNL